MELVINNINQINKNKAEVNFSMKDNKGFKNEGFIDLIRLDGNFNLEKVKYMIANLIMKGEAIIYKKSRYIK